MSNIVVPELGESVVEARVARWLKKEGDRVEVGEPVVELETEKIDLEVNAEKGGVLASIKRQEGEDVKIGELLAVVDETRAAAPGNGATDGKRRAGEPRRQPQGRGAGTGRRQRRRDHARRRPRSAWRRSTTSNLGAVQGSGSAGRVMKQDVQSAVQACTGAPSTRRRQARRARPSDRTGARLARSHPASAPSSACG